MKDNTRDKVLDYILESYLISKVVTALKICNVINTDLILDKVQQWL